jgi:hypothetical protein
MVLKNQKHLIRILNSNKLPILLVSLATINFILILNLFANFRFLITNQKQICIFIARTRQRKN